MSTRRRLLVALVVPRPVADEIDGLRRALGVRELSRLPPHITLVPPINVGEEELPAALALVRDASAKSAPIDIVLGPANSFRPTRPVSYLEVSGDVGALFSLRRDLNVSPLEPPISRVELSFVPHVTLRSNTSEELLAAALVAFSYYSVRVTFDRVHLFEQLEESTEHRWTRLADFRLGRPGTVGTGGRAVRFLQSERLSELEESFFAEERAFEDSLSERRSLDDALAVTAHVDDELVGVARARVVGDTLQLLDIVISQRRRGEGIGHQLLGVLARIATERQLRRIVVVVPANNAIVRFFSDRGYLEREAPDAARTRDSSSVGRNGERTALILERTLA